MIPRLTVVDRVIVGLCLLWLFVWVLIGIVAVVDVYSLTHERGTSLQKAATVFAVFGGIGCIALIGLWPHRWILHRKRHRQTGRGFEVKL